MIPALHKWWNDDLNIPGTHTINDTINEIKGRIPIRLLPLSLTTELYVIHGQDISHSIISLIKNVYHACLLAVKIYWVIWIQWTKSVPKSPDWQVVFNGIISQPAHWPVLFHPKQFIYTFIEPFSITTSTLDWTRNYLQFHVMRETTYIMMDFSA